MLAWFCERTAPWSERLPMRKEAAYAAGSTECDFPNGAAELWSATFRMARLNCGRAEKEAAKPREARSATFRMARLNCGRAEKEAAKPREARSAAFRMARLN